MHNALCCYVTQRDSRRAQGWLIPARISPPVGPAASRRGCTRRAGKLLPAELRWAGLPGAARGLRLKAGQPAVNFPHPFAGCPFAGCPLPAPRRPLPRGCPRRRRQSPRAPRFIARRCRRRGPKAADERRPDCTEPAGEARRELPPPALRTWAPLPSTAPGPAWRDRFSRPTCPTAGLRRAAPRSRLRHRGAAWG